MSAFDVRSNVEAVVQAHPCFVRPLGRQSHMSVVARVVEAGVPGRSAWRSGFSLLEATTATRATAANADTALITVERVEDATTGGWSTCDRS